MTLDLDSVHFYISDHCILERDTQGQPRDTPVCTSTEKCMYFYFKVKYNILILISLERTLNDTVCYKFHFEVFLREIKYNSDVNNSPMQQRHE